MPRLTNKDFLKRHYFLAKLWENEQLCIFFTILGPMEQLDLHQYYQTINTGNDADIIETRSTVNAGDMALPQKAGRAYRQIEDLFVHQVEYFGIAYDPEDLIKSIPALQKARLKLRDQKPAKTIRRGPSKHAILPLMKPKPDLERLAKTLLSLAMDVQKETDANGGVLPDKWKYLEKARKKREKREQTKKSS